MEIELVKNIPQGSILWKDEMILGVVGSTLPTKYEEAYCRKLEGNDLDYEYLGIVK